MAMPSAPTAPGATQQPSIPPSMTLRALLDARRNEGRRMSLDEAVAVIVPVCLDLQERHARGERLYVHPSAIAPGADGLARLNPKLAIVPTNQHDKHCLAPELQRTLEPGDRIASVYSLGAILYEMVTGLHIGPAMKRPRDVEPSLPEHIEMLIGKAIIGDRAHRPATSARSRARCTTWPRRRAFTRPTSARPASTRAPSSRSTCGSRCCPRHRAGARSDAERRRRQRVRRRSAAASALRRGRPFRRRRSSTDRAALPRRARRRPDEQARRHSRRGSRATLAPATSSTKTRWITARSRPSSCCNRSPRTRS